MKVTNKPSLLNSIMIGTCFVLSVCARPLDIRSPNLDPVRGGTLPSAIHVPVGGDKLLSQGCAVTSSAAEPCRGDLSFITDGDKECDANESNMVKIAQGVQWVQVDLRTSQVINAVCIWRYHPLPRVYRDVVVQLANDVCFTQGIVTVFNNDHDNSADLGIGNDKEYIDDFSGKTLAVPSVRARYVRVYSNGGYLDRGATDSFNYYTEIEVYGGESVSQEKVPLKVELPRPQFR